MKRLKILINKKLKLGEIKNKDKGEKIERVSCKG